MSWRWYLRDRVVVNLKTGSAAQGVLYRSDRRTLELKEAVVHEPGAEPVTADGSLVIPLDNVDYMQIVG